MENIHITICKKTLDEINTSTIITLEENAVKGGFGAEIKRGGGTAEVLYGGRNRASVGVCRYRDGVDDKNNV